jgi:hypothetical protein
VITGSSRAAPLPQHALVLIWLRVLSFDAKLRSPDRDDEGVWRKRLYARARIEEFEPLGSKHPASKNVAEAGRCESIK